MATIEFDRDTHPCEVLEQAAQEFDRRAMLPEYGHFERARILACATWLRDMSQEIKDEADELLKSQQEQFLADFAKWRASHLAG